jgi:hypothetical protein
MTRLDVLLQRPGLCLADIAELSSRLLGSQASSSGRG